MSLAISTGVSTVKPCSVCGVTVEHREYAYSSGGRHSSAVTHDAPCGAQCIGGGLRGVKFSYGPLERQGHTSKGCVRCDTRPRSP